MSISSLATAAYGKELDTLRNQYALNLKQLRDRINKLANYQIAYGPDNEGEAQAIESPFVVAAMDGLYFALVVQGELVQRERIVFGHSISVDVDVAILCSSVDDVAYWAVCNSLQELGKLIWNNWTRGEWPGITPSKVTYASAIGGKYVHNQ